MAIGLGWLLSAPFAHAAPEYVEGEVIVTFKPTTSLETAKAALSKKSVAFTEHFGPLSEHRKRQTGLVREKGKTTAQLIESLKDDPTVETVEPNYVRHVKATPNDTRFAELWALNNTGQTVNGTRGTASDDVSFLLARSLSRTSTSEIVVGVIDTGVDTMHPDLAANIWTNSLETAFNRTDDDGNGYVDDVHGYDFASGDADATDSGSHGTHVAGTIAAIGNNSAGVIGISERVKLLPLKVSSDGDSINSSAEIKALQYATALKLRGVNIVALNASFGGGGNSTAEKAAIQTAGDAGIILCVAAGNETANNDSTPSYPASYRLSNEIVVAATDQNDALASYSNYGATTVDIAAPGSNILSTKPSTVTFQAGGTTYSATAFTYSGLTTGLTGSIVDCGAGNSAAEFPAAVRGNIALIQRGTQTFTTKVTYAMNAGAKAAIIYNNTNGPINGTLQTASNWIPTYAISQANGLAIRAALPTSGAVVVTGNYQFLDGTSMAAPHVTGAVAFAALNFPGDTVAQRRQRVLAGVDVKASLQGKMVANGRLNLRKIIDANLDGVADWAATTYPTLAVSTTTLPSGAVSAGYNATLTATGGDGTYSWTVQSGTLPAGLSLKTSGILSGTPTAGGSYSFVAQVGDQHSHTARHTFSLIIAYPTLSITTASLGNGTVGSDYSQLLAATGGTGSYTFTKSAGTLPTGLTLSTGGLISGDPTAAGTFTFTAKVTDTASATATRSFSVTIAAAPVTAVQLNFTSEATLPGGAVSAAYTDTIRASGGSGGGYVFVKLSGTLPAGLALSTAGVLSGNPTASGTFSFAVRVKDSAGNLASKAFSITIAPLAAGAVGTFNGNIARQSSVNGNLGGYFSLTTSATGVYTGKLILGAVSKAFTGRLVGSVGGNPTLTATATFPTYGTLTLKLTLNASVNSATGTLASSSGSAAVSGWRYTWNASTNPATSRLGYYVAALDFANTAYEGQAAIPQGVGSTHFSVPKSGVVVVVGRAADGSYFANSSLMGPNGEILVYYPLSSGQGSIAGNLKVTPAAAITDNSVTGSLSWLKPADNTRSYAAGFGPLALSAAGKYLASAVTGQIVLGLPAPGTPAKLAFTEGGLTSASTHPNTTFTYTSANTVSLPAAGGTQNPGKVTLAINQNNGAISGTFKVADGGITRSATFMGSIVRLSTTGYKGVGYFLLPQIPASGQTAATAPILSGQFVITQ